MYEKARRGESIELSPRQISIFQFDVERSLDDRYFMHIKHIYPFKTIYFSFIKIKMPCTLKHKL